VGGKGVRDRSVLIPLCLPGPAEKAMLAVCILVKRSSFALQEEEYKYVVWCGVVWCGVVRT